MSRDILPVMSGAVGRAEQASGPVRDKAAQHEPITDEVDQLVQEWRVQRPDLDVAPLHVLSRIWRLARHLDRARSEEHTSELQSRPHLVCRLLLEKKKKNTK